jgi:SAF domain-containing protein
LRRDNWADSLGAAVIRSTEPSKRAPRRLRNAIILGGAGVILLVVAAGRGDAGAPVQMTQQTSVVVTTRPLPASALVAAADVTIQRVPASDFDAAMARALDDVLGKRLLLPLPAHTPVARAMVGAATPPLSGDPSHRVVRLQLPSSHVAPDLGVLADAEVVASSDTAAAAPARKVEVVAVCRLLQLDTVAATSSSAAASSSVGVTTPGPDTEAVIDCAADAALRVVFAADFAHSVRLLSHPPAASTPAAVAIGASG